jgi:hypothetical protein
MIFLAEREGFEPSVPLLTAHTISSRAPSASSDISPLSKFIIFRCPLWVRLLSPFPKRISNLEPCRPCGPGFGFSLKGPIPRATEQRRPVPKNRVFSAAMGLDYYGGEGGIRTHDPVFDRIPLFESGAFSRSATSPVH